jgi:hypothetical protein
MLASEQIRGRRQEALLVSRLRFRDHGRGGSSGMTRLG